MLKQIRIQNLILVEDVTIPFHPGLNILTGETGSGKSAILQGIALAIGERTDTSLIRKGSEKGIIEAIFDSEDPSLTSLLDEAGIAHDFDQELVIRREINLNGKSRIFINNQSAQLTFLKKIGTLLVQSVGQHANQRLYSIETHRQILDTYGDIANHLESFRSSYMIEIQLREQLNTFIQEESYRLREIDRLQAEIEELDEAMLKPNEDDDLFAEYTVLNHSEELSSKVEEINQVLSGDKQNLLSMLNRQKQNLEQMVTYDSVLEETSAALKSIWLELQEISHTLRHYQNKLNRDPDRYTWIENRLSIINRLKRKYGSTLEAVILYKKNAGERLLTLEQADFEIERLKGTLTQQEHITQHHASRLTEERSLFAKKLEEELTLQLRSLNMSEAKFSVETTPQKRSYTGDDRIEFFLLPNIGENQIPLKDGASGGEISRILLAIQTLLAGKEKTATLIFDEVDANIGGETASIVAHKLKEISSKHQVIPFPKNKFTF